MQQSTNVKLLPNMALTPNVAQISKETNVNNIESNNAQRGSVLTNINDAYSHKKRSSIFEDYENCFVTFHNSKQLKLHSFRIKNQRDREPSRINWKKFLSMRKKKQFKHQVKKYIYRCVPKSSSLQLVRKGMFRKFVKLTCETNPQIYWKHKMTINDCDLSCKWQQHFTSRKSKDTKLNPSTNENTSLQSNKKLMKLKNDKCSLFEINVDKIVLNKSKCSQMQAQIHHVSQRLIFLSGDVEKNPGPSNNFNNVNNAAAQG